MKEGPLYGREDGQAAEELRANRTDMPVIECRKLISFLARHLAPGKRRAAAAQPEEKFSDSSRIGKFNAKVTEHCSARRSHVLPVCSAPFRLARLWPDSQSAPSQSVDLTLCARTLQTAQLPPGQPETRPEAHRNIYSQRPRRSEELDIYLDPGRAYLGQEAVDSSGATAPAPPESGSGEIPRTTAVLWRPLSRIRRLPGLTFDPFHRACWLDLRKNVACCEASGWELSDDAAGSASTCAEDLALPFTPETTLS